VHDDRRLTEARLDRVLRERVWPAVYTTSIPLEVARWDAPGEPVPAAEGISAPHEPARVGDAWGPAWGTTWFRLRGRVPAEWAGRTVEAVVDLGFDSAMPGFQCEGLVHLADGTVVKGLNPRNAWIPVGSPATGEETVEFHVEAAANPVILGNPPFQPTDLGSGRGPGDQPLYELTRADLAVFERQVWELALDLEVAGGLMRELGTGDPRRWDLLRALGRTLDALDLQDVPGTAERARAVLAPVLRSPASASAHRLSAVGHAHIDSAWLWPLRETVRKVARTSANVVALMEDHPEFVFAMSQAQQWAWLKEHRPDVFARVVKAAEAGQFVPVGGMWVESDTNMPGSEALARQFTFGKRFFRDELGVDTQEVWLPDSFGYSAALPQLVRLSGSRWFLTQKISWSQVNQFPHHTFWWEGLDGTRVFTHFPPVDTYNSELTGHELAHAARNFREKGRATRSLVPFGHGDGGGGRPGGLAPGGDPAPGRVLRGGGGRVPGRPGVVGRAVPGVPPRHLHQPGPHQAGQPPVRAPAARGRAVVDHRGGAPRRGQPPRGAGPGLAPRAGEPVARHPAGPLPYHSQDLFFYFFYFITCSK
jgi:alpha-mannosidase